MSTDANDRPDEEQFATDPVDAALVPEAGGAAVAGDDLADTGDPMTDAEPDAGDDDGTGTVSGGRRVLGLLLALLLALAGAVGWAALTTATGRRFALLAVAVGIVIGVVVRRIARMSGIGAGIVAALLSLLGAGLGQFFEGYALQANAVAEAPIRPADKADWGIWKQYEEWGFSRGWEVFTDNLTALAWLTLGLAAAAAFIYAADSGKRRAAEPTAADESPAGEATMAADEDLMPGAPDDDLMPTAADAAGTPFEPAGQPPAGEGDEDDPSRGR